MAINEIAKIICLKSPFALFKKLHISERNNKNIIIFRNRKFGKNSVLIAFSFWNIIVKKLKIPNPNEILLSKLTHEGPERHVSCLARHYFANVRKMLWSCEG